MRRWLSFLLLVPAFTSATPLTLAPLVDNGKSPFGVISNSYIVVFKDDVPATLVTNHFDFLRKGLGSLSADPTRSEGVTHVYKDLLNGYAGVFSEDVVDEIRSRPEVAYVELDQVVRTAAADGPVLVQPNATWGLARISSRTRWVPGASYTYAASAGAGTCIYVIDTGINTNHTEFEGRASWGRTIPAGASSTDTNGHGTHCAGTVASKTWGVAKRANVIAVKVLGDNGSGTTSDVIAGVQWAATDRGTKRCVASISLAGGFSSALNTAVNNAVASGMPVVVAAGSGGVDAGNYSPASAANAITVGASTITDAVYISSNYGRTIALFAPGANITSTWPTSNTAINTLSGTSTAAPHVAGQAAVFLGETATVLTPAALKQLLVDSATTDVLSGVPAGTVNALLFNNAV